MIAIYFFLGIVVIVHLFLFIKIYNAFVELESQVDRAWANIDVILEQRFQEIPKLISILEQYLQYERSVLDRILVERKEYLSLQKTDKKIDAANKLLTSLNQLVALGESNPQIKSNSEFNNLALRISALENEISDRKELVNEAVTNLNTRRRQFPDLIIAFLLRINELPLYKPEIGQTQHPSLKVKLP